MALKIMGSSTTVLTVKKDKDDVFPQTYVTGHITWKLAATYGDTNYAAYYKHEDK